MKAAALCFLGSLMLVFAMCGCDKMATAQESNQEPAQVEPFAMGQGSTTPPASGPYYVGHKDSFIVYYPDCPLVDDIPEADRRYHTSVPSWHRLDECRGDLCQDVTCPDGQHCEEGNCVDDDPCDGVTCPDGLVCNDGDCVDPCTLITCPDGQTCVNGTCVDPCEGIDCGDGFVCSNGDCLPDLAMAQEYMTGPHGWGDGVKVQPAITIHPKDLDADHDIDLKDFQIAQVFGEWEVAEMPWEEWPHVTLYVKTNFRYNSENFSQIDDKIDSTHNPPLVLLRAHVMELPFGWIWRGRARCSADGRLTHRNSLLYGRTYENPEDAAVHYYATKAQNWGDAGEMELVDRPEIGTNGLDATVKDLYLYSMYPDWVVTFTGTAADGSVHDNSPVKGVALSRDGYELLLDTDPTTYVWVSYNMTVHIEEVQQGAMNQIDRGYFVGAGRSSDVNGNSKYYIATENHKAIYVDETTYAKAGQLLGGSGIVKNSRYMGMYARETSPDGSVVSVVVSGVLP